MNFFNYKPPKPSTNTINYNLFSKKTEIPKLQNYSNHLYSNYHTNFNAQQKSTKIIPNYNNNENYISSYNLKSYRNTKQNVFQDIDLLKIKMSFDFINQKIKNMENIIHSLNESNEDEFFINDINDNKNIINKIYLRDKIKHRKVFGKKHELRKKNNLYKKSIEKFEPENKMFSTHHNYSVQNLKDQKLYNNFINDSKIESKNNYSNYYSIQNEKSNKQYNSYINLNENNYSTNYNRKNHTMDVIQNKSSHNLNTHRIIPNQKKIISKKIKYNNNFFNNINNNIPNIKINNNTIGHIKNHHLNNYINNKKINDKNVNNKNIGEYFGSFDEYFLPENQMLLYQSKEQINNNKNNNKIKRINVLHKKENKENNNTNFNIYNIVKNDKIIQNNYFETKNRNNPSSNNDKNNNLIIENQNSISFNVSNNNNNNSKNNFKNNSEKKIIKDEFTRNKFVIEQLKKCSATDLFIPKNNLKNKINNELDNNQDKNRNNNKIIKENRNNYGKSKDDFYYDLYTEKIIEINRKNNSYDEIHLFQKIKNNYNNIFEKNKVSNHIINEKIKKEKKNNQKKVKKVRFLEENNKIIKINQKESPSKFEVFNNSGKKIFHKKFNINIYLKKLKNRNLKIKSIYINKKEEIEDNSEWDKLYDIINQIAKKNNKEQNKNEIKVQNNKNKVINKKGKFNIKNIESFKKNKKKNFTNNKK